MFAGWRTKVPIGRRVIIVWSFRTVRARVPARTVKPAFDGDGRLDFLTGNCGHPCRRSFRGSADGYNRPPLFIVFPRRTPAALAAFMPWPVGRHLARGDRQAGVQGFLSKVSGTPAIVDNSSGSPDCTAVARSVSIAAGTQGIVWVAVPLWHAEITPCFRLSPTSVISSCNPSMTCVIVMNGGEACFPVSHRRRGAAVAHRRSVAGLRRAA